MERSTEKTEIAKGIFTTKTEDLELTSIDTGEATNCIPDWIEIFPE